MNAFKCLTQQFLVASNIIKQINVVENGKSLDQLLLDKLLNRLRAVTMSIEINIFFAI